MPSLGFRATTHQTNCSDIVPKSKAFPINAQKNPTKYKKTGFKELQKRNKKTIEKIVSIFKISSGFYKFEKVKISCRNESETNLLWCL